MPTVLETAKDATYTALGFNVLLFDEVNERFTTPREQWEEQLDIARDHARKARAEWQKQADEFNANVKQRLPFDLDELTGQFQDRVQPVVRRSWEAAEPMFKRVADLTPAPLGTYMKDGVQKMHDIVIDEDATTAKAKTGTKKSPKTEAKKSPKTESKKADTADDATAA